MEQGVEQGVEEGEIEEKGGFTKLLHKHKSLHLLMMVDGLQEEGGGRRGN